MIVQLMVHYALNAKIALIRAQIVLKSVLLIAMYAIVAQFAQPALNTIISMPIIFVLSAQILQNAKNAQLMLALNVRVDTYLFLMSVLHVPVIVLSVIQLDTV